MTMSMKARISMLLASLALSACSSNDDDPSANPGSGTDPSSATSPRVTTDAYVGVDCAELASAALVSQGLFGEQDANVECGFVTVPANWSEPDGETIQLAVYRVPSTATSPAPDPVIYLEGGPGGAGVASLSSFSDPTEAGYLRERSDVLVMDQRGTGYSKPALYCPEVSAAETDDTDVGAAYAACRDRLVILGVDFSDYNSANNARDVDAVRAALGYERWNLYGLSYGTRLAMTAIRDNPEPINSVILDSVFPPEVNGIAEFAYPTYFAIEQIAINCAADADCNANIGDIKTLIEQGIARLDDNPIAVGEETFGATDYIELLGNQIASEEVALVAVSIATASDAELSKLLPEFLGSDGEEELPPYHTFPETLYPFVADTAELMYYAVVCQEEFPFSEDLASPAIAGNFSETTQRVVNQTSDIDSSAAICELINVPAADRIEVQPVTADTPALVVAGTADLATPPAWSMLAAESLPNAQYAEFAGLTHGLLGNNSCLNGITRAFLDSPDQTVNQACIVDLPSVDYVTE